MRRMSPFTLRLGVPPFFPVFVMPGLEPGIHAVVGANDRGFGMDPRGRARG